MSTHTHTQRSYIYRAGGRGPAFAKPRAAPTPRPVALTRLWSPPAASIMRRIVDRGVPAAWSSPGLASIVRSVRLEHGAPAPPSRSSAAVPLPRHVVVVAVLAVPTPVDRADLLPPVAAETTTAAAERDGGGGGGGGGCCWVASTGTHAGVGSTATANRFIGFAASF